MQATEQRAEAILNSPLGCTFMMAAHESALEPEALSAPELSLRMAAASVNLISQWQSDHEIVVAKVLEYGKELKTFTRAVLEHAGTSWWFDPIDLSRQLWVNPEGVPPDTAAWHPPRGPILRLGGFTHRNQEGIKIRPLYSESTVLYSWPSTRKQAITGGHSRWCAGSSRWRWI